MRTIIRAFLIVIVLVLGVVALMTYWPSSSWRHKDERAAPAVGTTGAVEKAREQGAALGEKIGEKTAIATEKIRDTAHDAKITAKIKAKMALDDSVKARAIDVSTDGSTVTLNGTVGSVREHDRAMALARETVGVTRVIDRLVIQNR